MKRWALLCGAMLLFAAAASAQDTPRIEAFGGYSYVRVNPGFGISGENYNGGSGSVAFNLNSWLGVVGDVGGYHWSQSTLDATAVTYLFGPKVSLRTGPITPFVQTLFGGARLSGTANGGCGGAIVHSQQTIFGGCGSGSENAFAMALGGGLDWNATKHIGVRLIQAEYLMTRFGVVDSADTQNNARISAGVVFRF